MPSAKILEQKKQIVQELTDKLNNAVVGVLVDYKGINVSDDTALRKTMRESGVEYTVVKNSLLGFAADNANLGELKEQLKGSTALALSNEDYIAPAKLVQEQAEKGEIYNIKCGFIDGKVVPAADIIALSKLPSKEVLVAKALGGLNAPISGLVHVLNANLSGLVRTLAAVRDQQA